MPKDLSLMEIHCKIPTRYIRDVLLYLEDHEAQGIVSRPFRTDEKPKAANLVARGNDQREWLLKNTKGTFTVGEIIDEWERAGFQRGSIYSALARAVRDKIVKKAGPGKYRRLTHG
jgi:hypothetical protein